MPGFQIGSSCEGLNLDSPELDPIYKTCEELGAVLFVHPWDMQMGGRMSKYWLPWLVRTKCFGGETSNNSLARPIFTTFMSFA